MHKYLLSSFASYSFSDSGKANSNNEILILAYKGLPIQNVLVYGNSILVTSK